MGRVTGYPESMGEVLTVEAPTVPAWRWPAVLGGVAAVALLLTAWRPAQALAWWLVPYTFVGNSLAMVPYDWYIPAVVHTLPAWLVVVLAVAATVLVEFWNLELVARLLAHRRARAMRSHPMTHRLVRWYRVAPWWTLTLAAALPVIPFYPCRFLAVLARYPAWRYQFAIVVGRGARYAGLAGVGLLLPIPPAAYLAVGAAMVLVIASRVLLARRGARSDA